MRERLLKLLTIKSIITIMTALVFCYLSIIGIITPEIFMTVFTMIISFYFGTQAARDNSKE